MYGMALVMSVRVMGMAFKIRIQRSLNLALRATPEREGCRSAKDVDDGVLKVAGRTPSLATVPKHHDT